MQHNLVVQSQLNVSYLLESEALSDSWVNNSYELVWINLTYTALNELDKCLLNKHLTPSLSCKLSLLYTWTKFVFLMFVKLKFKIFIDLLFTSRNALLLFSGSSEFYISDLPDLSIMSQAALPTVQQLSRTVSTSLRCPSHPTAPLRSVGPHNTCARLAWW